MRVAATGLILSPLIVPGIVVAIGVVLRHSFYDCLYLALARRKTVRLVTADRRLRNKTAGTAYASLILWIEDVP